MLTVSGDEEMKNILVSWSHQVGTAPTTYTPFMRAHMHTYTHTHTHTHQKVRIKTHLLCLMIASAVPKRMYL